MKNLKSEIYRKYYEVQDQVRGQVHENKRWKIHMYVYSKVRIQVWDNLRDLIKL